MLAAAGSLLSCSARAGQGEWPTTSWRSSTLEAQGVDATKIAAMLSAIEGGDLGLHSLLIVKNGYLVSENYFQGFDKDRRAEVYSVTKSVVSTLCGIAMDMGKIEGPRLALADVLDYASFRNQDPRKRAITIEDLLTMRSGLEWTEGDRAYMAMMSSPDAVQYVAGQTMVAQPGTVFNYSSGAVHLLSAVLAKKSGMETAKFAARHLFGPLGIRDFAWQKDRAGLSIGGWGLQLRPRDMAKLGYLMLREGRWEGRQILSTSWVDSAVGARVTDTGSADGLQYGYLWWVYPAVRGFAALGLGGQTILVVPGLDLVAVITASTPDHGHKEIFRLMEKYLVPAAGG
jgi:CubicO group peptidase (beta-lactamase class C family)